MNRTEYALYHLRAPVEMFTEAAKSLEIKWGYAAMRLLSERLQGYQRLFGSPGNPFFQTYYLFSALYLLMQATIPHQPGVNNNPPEQGEVRNLPNR